MSAMLLKPTVLPLLKVNPTPLDCWITLVTVLIDKGVAVTAV
jgi:hypothetical protein